MQVFSFSFFVSLVGIQTLKILSDLHNYIDDFARQQVLLFEPTVPLAGRPGILLLLL